MEHNLLMPSWIQLHANQTERTNGNRPQLSERRRLQKAGARRVFLQVKSASHWHTQRTMHGHPAVRELCTVLLETVRPKMLKTWSYYTTIIIIAWREPCSAERGRQPHQGAQRWRRDVDNLHVELHPLHRALPTTWSVLCGAVACLRQHARNRLLLQASLGTMVVPIIAPQK